MNPSNKLLSDIVTYKSYASFNPFLSRREIFSEIVNRNLNMHLEKFPNLSTDILKAYKQIHERHVAPSMRSMQFGGPQISKNNTKLFNCSFANADYERVFAEALYVLLCGTGFGFSCQKHHISRLPTIKTPTDEGTYTVHDSIAGWAEALDRLMSSYFNKGVRPIFNFNNMRPKGTKLSSGAKTPGFEPLQTLLVKIEQKLKTAIGRKLRSIEVHDIMCIIADGVLSGGIRRAALISLFSHDDEEMLTCKQGSWWEKHPHRARANNSAVLLRETTTQADFNKVFDACIESNSGEPGFMWSNSLELGANPSLRAGTKVLTDKGVFLIEKLEGKTFNVPNLNGMWSEAICFQSGKNIQLYELTLDTGEKYYASPEHKWPINTNGRFIKCTSSELKKGDLLPVNVFNRSSLINCGTIGTKEQGFLIGWLYGDGSLTVRSDTKKLVASFIVSDKDGDLVLNKLLNEIKKIDEVTDRKIYRRKNCSEFQVGSEQFTEWLKLMGVKNKKEGIPDGVWTDWSEDCRRGFIDGLFSSDGHVPNDLHGVSFSSSKEKLAKDIQDLLGFYGIKTSLILKEQNNVSFPNGRKYDKTYYCYTVRTTVQGRRKFSELFKLTIQHKQDLLNIAIVEKQEFIKLVDIKLTEMKEDVWDISVRDETHCFQLPQVTTGNCLEISLNSNQFCNLTSVNLTGVTTKKDLHNRVYAAALLGTLQATYTDFPYLNQNWKVTTEKEALLGVSFTGIADNTFVTPELLVDSAKLVLDVNEKYAKKLGINLAARTTCVKPEGSASCVVGSSSGIHARHNDYYLRRVRVNKDDSLTKYLLSVVPELVEDDLFSPTGVVVTIPQESPEGAVTRHTESAETLFNRIIAYNKNWVSIGHRSGENKHNVSCTISYKKEEVSFLKQAMWDNRLDYTGISLLPFDGGSYQQAPFEDCSRETFEKYSNMVKEIDLTKVIEMDDNTNHTENLACAGGICEII